MGLPKKPTGFFGYVPGCLMIIIIISVCVADNTLLVASLFHGFILDDTWSDRCAELTRAVGRLSLLNAHDALLLLQVSFSAQRVQHLLRCSPSVDHFGLTSFDATLRSALSQISNMDISDIQWLQASLPIRQGGLGIRQVHLLALPAFFGLGGEHLRSPVTDLVVGCVPFHYVL